MAVQPSTCLRDLPRLSVDIDLTYVPLEERLISLDNINDGLGRIKNQIEKNIPNSSVIHKQDGKKLIIHQNRTEVKTEVNFNA
jgi:hypothetical protein